MTNKTSHGLTNSVKAAMLSVDTESEGTLSSDISTLIGIASGIPTSEDTSARSSSRAMSLGDLRRDTPLSLYSRNTLVQDSVLTADGLISLPFNVLKSGAKENSDGEC